MDYQRFLKVDDKYYISTNSTYADDRTRVLNDSDTFGVFDRWGDIQPIGQEVQGLYHEGTRFLSALEIRLNGERPLLLSSSIKEENEVLSVDLTNPEYSDNGTTVHQGMLHISRKKFIQHGACFETIQLTNYDTQEHTLSFAITAHADFKDIFEVRGMKRPNRGELGACRMEKDTMILSYRGLDKVERKTEITFSPHPDTFSNHQVEYHITLTPQQTYDVEYSIQLRTGDELTKAISHDEAMQKLTQQLQDTRAIITTVQTSNEQFNHWINRSKTDLVSLLTDTPHGKYPYAGVPWYNTVFGRDGILTAYETLWVAPEIARGVLNFIAQTQAQTSNPARDAEPGKVFHEIRGGEMVALNELPFGHYYGTVDATPLFVMLAGAYYQRTGDKTTIRQIWPNIKSALQWIDTYGDIDGDGFVEYQHKSENGLTNQGWKDSFDSVMHEDGTLAEPPIALCEVQGYVYAAKVQAAQLALIMSDKKLSRQLNQEATLLKQKFNQSFWDKKFQTFILALDGDQLPCRVKSSNAGQCLFTGIVEEELAHPLANTLMSEDMFSGWGIRTLGIREARYNPMSYHNGSIWPHDVALIAYGLSQYGFQKEAQRITAGLFDAALFLDLQRLPELFCGFDRRPGEGPTAYPVACSPQAWSVASVFLLLQSLLNLRIDALSRRITFHCPTLPDYLEHIRIERLQLGSEYATLEMHRQAYDVGIQVIDKPNDWEIVICK
ncbi:MAG: amylo-alpha-1,6-glucosidase [Bacteroidota bacterium]